MTTPHVAVCYRPGEFVLPGRYATRVPPGRLASTPGDNLAEFSARLCYDSLTAAGGRPTAAYHAHIHETGHLSVYAHVVETFEAAVPDPATGFRLLAALAGRPGVWVTHVGDVVRFAASLRAVLEWNAHGVGGGLATAVRDDVVAQLGHRHPHALAPVLPPAAPGGPRVVWRVDPQLPRERWLSLYIDGVSRDLLQELVRHHYQTNPSVRSTRDCDESASVQLPHPAVAACDGLAAAAARHAAAARTLYARVFRELTARGVDRKTARGAARSVLPGATETRLVYSLSEFQARHLLSLRADQTTGAVDPEIGRLAGAMRTVLRADGWAV